MHAENKKQSRTDAAPAWDYKEGARAYGISEFAELRDIGAFHVDRSHYIKKLDYIKGAVLLRPPRFGKTLFLSMLEAYYSISLKGRFEELFDGLAITADNTRDKSLQSAFYVLRLSLPGTGTESKDLSYAQKFHNKVNDAVSVP